ncbi:UNVERIFIED_CONTAM: hypothetical protein RMT77_016185 [Armadillidium vulgare]
MYKIFLFVVVLGTTLADDDFDDRFDDSREIHYVRGRLSPTLKAVGVPLPFDFFKSVPVTKTDAGVSPIVKTASDVEVVHVDQQVEPITTPEVTEPKVEIPAVNFRTPFIVKVDDDDDDDDDDRVYFRRTGASAVPLTYSAGPYGFKFDFDDDDDDDDDDRRVFFRNINPKFRNAFRIGEDVDKNFFRSVGVPLPTVVKYDDDKKVLLKSGVNTAPKYIVKVDDDDDYGRYFFRTAFGNASPIPYSGRFKFDDDLFDFDDDK